MPDAITYRNSPHDIPGWNPGALNSQGRGYAYALDGFFVHVYGFDHGLWTISPGLTATEARGEESLEAWVTRRFGAAEITPVRQPVGTAIDGVWRPGLAAHDQLLAALAVTRHDQRLAEQSLQLLISALSDLLIYVEPSGPGREAYSAKTRELLILACTEVEDGWAQHLKRANVPRPPRGYSTNDYVRLRDSLDLPAFEIGLVPYPEVPAIRPFAAWDAAQPTRSLPWYHAYNKAKHDRTTNLPQATVERCIAAVAACLAMHCVRFGPYSMYNDNTPVAGLVSHLFSLELVEPEPASFYVPLVELPPDQRRDLIVFSGDHVGVPWTTAPLKV